MRPGRIYIRSGRRSALWGCGCANPVNELSLSPAPLPNAAGQGLGQSFGTHNVADRRSARRKPVVAGLINEYHYAA